MGKKLITSILFVAGLAYMVTAIPAQATFTQQGFHQGVRQENSLAAFEAQLSGAEEVPAVLTPASGRAVMVYDDESNQLYYRVTVDDITDITMAHIHVGLAGVNGPVVFPLFPNGGASFSPDESISGSLILDDAQASELLAGNYYVNVHTTTYPGGEIRGQLEQFIPPARFSARLSGAEEVPPVETDASGNAIFQLNNQAELNRLSYHVQISGTITTLVAAHLHTGWPGENGPVAVPLFTPGDEREFAPGSPLSGEVELTAENLRDLLTGYYYVNVHSEANPGGELRGQVNVQRILFLPVIQKVSE
jgi:trimeric autotransporter adhesin